MKIIEKLSTYAALIGVIGAIGGGFYTWGQFNTRLDVIERKPPVNLKPLHEKDRALTQQFDEVLLYANEYKVDLIDRIKKVDDKIIKTDLTVVFGEIAKVREEIAGLNIPKDVDLKPISKELKRLSEELVRILATIPKTVNLKPLEEAIQAIEKALAIVKKENEVQDAEIKEIKLKASNPLAN
tara:strand:+ start:642 stop:1190 length:549 start_codon:yes stop_codon:yes gene_type:complete